MKKITICTPTYNRAHLLPRLYKTIKNQTFRDFEWLIIDDGSTDNTNEVVAKMIDNHDDFPICYYWKTNGGKSRAINYALDLADGQYFFIMDSDDYLSVDALEKIDYWMGTIAEENCFCGVAGNRGTSLTESPNTPLQGEYLDVNVLDKYRGNSALFGEHAEAFFTDIFRKYKYPEFEGENYLTPCIAFDRMAADGYLTRYFSDIIWVCNYLDDGLTMQGNLRFLKNPRGDGLWMKEIADHMHYSFYKRLRMWYSYYCAHSFCEEQFRLTKKQCSDYLEAPLLGIWFCAVVHKVIDFWKGIKKK